MVPPSPVSPEIRYVQDLWSAFEEDGAAAVIELGGEHVEWQPSLSQGRFLRGSDEATAFFADRERDGVVVQAKPYRYEQRGSCVIVTGSLRVGEHGGFSETTRVWVFRFDEGKLVGTRHFATHADALAFCDA